jgi:hypothetical protein
MSCPALSASASAALPPSPYVPSRAHENDDFLDIVALETIERLQVFCKDALENAHLCSPEIVILKGLGLATG